MAEITLVPVRSYNQTLTGIQDGANKIFTTAEKFISGSQAFYVNGVRQSPGVGCDYTISESSPGLGFDTITMDYAPISVDELLIDYTRC